MSGVRDSNLSDRGPPGPFPARSSPCPIWSSPGQQTREWQLPAPSSLPLLPEVSAQAGREGPDIGSLKFTASEAASPARSTGHTMTCASHVSFTYLQQLKHSKEVPSRQVPTKDGVIAQPGRLVVLVSQLHHGSSHCGAQVFWLPLTQKRSESLSLIVTYLLTCIGAIL